MAEAKCRCGGALVKPRSGPLPRYCSVSCRRSAEYELRRQQALLLRAEKAWQDARLRAEVIGGRWPEQAAWWQQEVTRLEDWLEQSLILQDQEAPDGAPTSEGRS